MTRTVDVLARLPVFSALDERSLQAVGVLAREVTAPAATVLMREGDEATSFFVIVRGTVRVERAGAFVRSISEGGFVGEIALLEPGPRTATVTCATGCELLEFGTFEFGRVLDTFPDVRTRIEAAIARRPHAAG